MNYTESLDHFITHNLNDEQRTAATHKSGTLLVIAGAGSGKTRVIIARIAYLILHEKQNAYAILALTFTNKAAREMKERIQKFLGHDHPMPFIGTFHAYCLRLLKQYAATTDLPFISVIDEDDQYKILNTILHKYGIQKQISARQALYQISHMKNQYGNTSYGTFANPLMHNIYTAYEAEKKMSKCFDFDDLLIETLRLFHTNELFRKQFHTRIRHVLVDEYQDTNVVQHALLKAMTQQEDKTLVSDSLCVVGDEDQSIYSWRGATIANMLNFQKDFAHTTIITIAQNYRSVKPVLDLANAVIAFNTQRKKKSLWSNRTGQDRIRLLTCLSEYQESDVIAHLLQVLKNNGNTLNSIAILYRTHAQSRALEEALIKQAIPYTIVGGVQFYERKEIKDMLAYLRLVVNPFDRVSLFRIINTPTRGLGDKSEEIIRQAWDKEPFLPFTEIIQRLCEHHIFPPSKEKALQQFIAIFEQLTPKVNPTFALECILKRSCYATFIKQEYEPEDAESRIQNLQELAKAMHYHERITALTVEQFLDDVALMQEKITVNNQQVDAVTLMTLHAAKGLEFDTIILAGLEEGLMPSTRALQDEAAIEEERRLLYVGITRARERLLVTHANYRYTYGSMSYQAASRFLAEMPRDLIKAEDCSSWSSSQLRTFFTTWIKHETVAQISEVLHTPPRQSTIKKPISATEQKIEATPSFKHNQPVTHKTYGTGLVQSVEHKTDGAQYVTVKFKTGTKKIVDRFLHHI